MVIIEPQASIADINYGLDIGGTKIELAIFNAEFKLVQSWRTPTPKDDYAEFLNVVCEMIKDADVKSKTLGNIGIGLPGVVTEDEEFISSNVPALNGQNFRADLSSLLSRRVGIENDAKTFVVSESNGGAIAGSTNSLGVILGTGLAGCQYVNGGIVRGNQGMAGEFGHISFSTVMREKYGFPILSCGCGNTGCAESYLSGNGLKWMCRYFNAPYKRAPELIIGLQNKEEKAREVFSSYIDCLGDYFAQLTMIFDPEKIVLGGGLSKITEIYQELPNSIERHLIDGLKAPIIVSPVFGDSSGVRGAAIIGQKKAIVNFQSTESLTNESE